VDAANRYEETDMPLLPGKKNVGKNIREMAKGPHHAKMARKLGAKKAHEMDVAASMREAYGPRKKKGKR
jgi:hypothetical protein